MTKRHSPHKKHMEHPLAIKFSNSILDQLDELVKDTQPVLETEKGSLFYSDKLPLAAIKIKIPISQYLDFIKSQDHDVRPRLANVVPVSNRNFEIVINTPLVVVGEQIEIEGRKVILI